MDLNYLMGPKSGGNYAGAPGPKIWAKMAKNRELYIAHGFCPNFAFSGREGIFGRHCRHVRALTVGGDGSRFRGPDPDLWPI